MFVPEARQKEYGRLWCDPVQTKSPKNGDVHNMFTVVYDACSYFLTGRDPDAFLTSSGATVRYSSRTWWIAWVYWFWWIHDDVIKWKYFPRYWPFVQGIHRSPVNSPHKDQWRGALMSSLIYAWVKGWVNNREAGDLRRHHAHYNVIVMISVKKLFVLWLSLQISYLIMINM